MKRILTYLSALTLVAIYLCGCVKTEHVPPIGEEYKSVLKLKIAQPINSSYVLTEDKINRLDILLFRNGVLNKVMLNLTSFDTNSDGYSSVTLTSEDEATQKAYVIANVDDISWVEQLKIGVTTTQDMAEIQTATLSQMVNPPLVMSGISEDIAFSEIANSVHLNLYRVVAKINVINTADNFTLESARLIQAKSAAMVFPGKISSEIPVTDLDQIQAIDSKVVLYTYENQQQSERTNTSVEIIGNVNGIPLTYSIPLNANDAAIKIERNFQYTVNINNVQQNSVTVEISTRPWISGDDINETVVGNTPVISALIEPSVGELNQSGDAATIRESGGVISVETWANAECGIGQTPDWIVLQNNTKASGVENKFTLTIKPNTENTERVAVIDFFNKLNNATTIFTIVQDAASVSAGEKYLVVVVAGQSNAVGYDESPVYPAGIHKPNPIAKQLSYRYGTTNPSITDLEWCAENLQDMKAIGKPNANGQLGMKGIQLPLANELEKRIPPGYKLLFISVAYGGTSLLTASNQSMLYDVVRMQPNVMNAPLQWGVGRPYNRTMIDRVKSVLSNNPDNKFLGVVWCQGENDAKRSEDHYAAFNAMTQDFFNNLNNSGYGSRCPRGVADKNLWYNYSSTNYWSNWNLSTNAASVFGGCKVWNPDTFIHVPFNTSTNEINGNGASSSSRASHFGNDTYSTVIAPMVAECMDRNGGLFNGKTPQNNQFVETSIRNNANSLGGSLNDSDLQTGILAFYPLAGSYASIIPNTKSIARQTTGASFSNVTDLVNIDGSTRAQTVFNLNATSTIRFTGVSAPSNWSLSFMLKRTGNFTAATQTLFYTAVNTPFIGFKKYLNINGGVGGNSEFVVEPNATTDSFKAVAAQFMDADNVRSLNNWVHYVITFNASTKTTSIYMNGELVGQNAISSAVIPDMSTILLGHSSTPVVGQISQFGIWNSVLTNTSVKKLYLYSYYGFSK